MICVGETKKRGAIRSIPKASRTLTLVPANCVGKGLVIATCVVVARFTPKAVTMESAAKLPA